jgi:gamma-D-glutamyl-L-lysine dipeptidyl-peptidase
MFMRKLIIIVISLVFFLGSCTQNKEEIFTTISKEIKSKYAPDRRDKTFQLKIKQIENKYVVYGSTTEKEAKDELFKTLKERGVEAEDSVVLLPDPALNGKIYAVVSHSVGNLRYEADYSSEMASQVLMGTPLRVLEKESYWYRVITPEGYIAWITSGSIKLMDEKEYNNWRGSDRLIITSYYTLFREGISSNSQVVCDGVWGDIVVNNNKDLFGHYSVTLANGTKAYLPKSDAQPLNKWLKSRKVTADNIISTAKSFLGFPYLWAGTSIKAMDCSGFTKTSFFLNGVILRRDASQQAKTGIDIDIANGIDSLIPGDLLFFGRKATEERSERISHVGIYIGNGEFIHSATSVRINSLLSNKENYYEGSTNLVRARRIIGSEDRETGISSISKHPWYFNKITL